MRATILILSVLAPAVHAGERAVSFRNEVMAVLSKAGCNLGTCHGNQNGKGGLKLSLRGQHPDRDYLTLARRLGSRRVNVLEPDHSLLLQKPLAEVPHEGGQRFDRNAQTYDVLRRWISSGTPADTSDIPTLVGLQVTPERQTVIAPDTTAHIKVIGEFSDGSSRDVTQLSVFEPSSLFVSVAADGRVSSERSGISAVTVRYLNLQKPVRLEFVAAGNGYSWRGPEARNFIDEEIFTTLRRVRMNMSPVCDDSAFVRRVFLDLTGLLPSAERARSFVDSKDPQKRAALIDELLESDEFNDMMTLRWADLLRVEEKTLDKKGVEVFHQWIRTSFKEHKPLNQFAADLIEARGSTYSQPPANFYRAMRKPEIRAESTAQIFLGIRLQCAKCHNHPFDRWTQEDYYGWSNFFAKIDYKIVENKRRDKNDKHEFSGEQIVLIKSDNKDVKNPETGQPAGLRFLGEGVVGGVRDEKEKHDRLRKLARWLTSVDNRAFAKTQTNRIWSQMMGRGIVDPVDDFRSTNPASHPELLERLTDEFIAGNYSVRHLMRLIANSTTYQLTSSTDETNADDETCFSHTQVRRLSAEQTVDAIAAVLGESVVFGGHKSGTRAVQLRGVRGGHRYSEPEIGDRFLLLFGKPARLQSCECERSNSTTLAQTFEMVSGELINGLVGRTSTKFAKASAAGTPLPDILDEMYWSALSRTPTTQEQTAASQHIESCSSQLQGLQDIAWALLNSNEFLLRR